MSNILLYLYALLVLTKSCIFKNIITKILFFIIVIVIFSSFNDPFDDYHNQQFELFYESEDVIIWHSRSLEITNEYGHRHKVKEYRKWEEKGKFDKRQRNR